MSFSLLSPLPSPLPLLTSLSPSHYSPLYPLPFPHPLATCFQKVYTVRVNPATHRRHAPRLARSDPVFASVPRLAPPDRPGRLLPTSAPPPSARTRHLSRLTPSSPRPPVAHAPPTPPPPARPSQPHFRHLSPPTSLTPHLVQPSSTPSPSPPGPPPLAPAPSRPRPFSGPPGAFPTPPDAIPGNRAGCVETSGNDPRASSRGRTPISKRRSALHPLRGERQNLPRTRSGVRASSAEIGEGSSGQPASGYPKASPGERVG